MRKKTKISAPAPGMMVFTADVITDHPRRPKDAPTTPPAWLPPWLSGATPPETSPAGDALAELLFGLAPGGLGAPAARIPRPPPPELPPPPGSGAPSEAEVPDGAPTAEDGLEMAPDAAAGRGKQARSPTTVAKDKGSTPTVARVGSLLAKEADTPLGGAAAAGPTLGQESWSDATKKSPRKPGHGARAPKPTIEPPGPPKSNEIEVPEPPRAEPRPGGGGGGGGAPRKVDPMLGGQSAGTYDALNTWKAGVSGKTGQLPKPAWEPDAPAAPIKKQGEQAAAKLDKAKAGLPKEAAAVVPEPPKPANAPEPVGARSLKELVPEAAALVEKATTRTLGDQTVPPLEQSPHGFMPVIERTEEGEYVYSGVAKTDAAKAALDHADKAIAAREAAEAAAKEAASAAKNGKGKDPKQDKAKQDVVPEKPVAKQELTKLAGEIKLHTDVPVPEPPPELGAEQQQTVGATMGSVVAMIMADLPDLSLEIVKAGRDAAYPNNALSAKAPDFGAGYFNQESFTIVNERMRAVASAVGVSTAQLDKMVALRVKEKQDKGKTTTQNLLAAIDDANKKVDVAGEEAKAAAILARTQTDEATAEEADRRKGDADPQAIKNRRDRMQAQIDKDVARSVVRYDNLGKGRVAALGEIEKHRARAYAKVLEQEEKILFDGKAPGTPEGLEAAKEKLRVERWVQDQIGKVTTLKGGAAEAARKLGDDALDAGGTAKGAVRAWAGHHLASSLSFWEWFENLFSDWKVSSDAITKAWEEQKARDTQVQIADEFNTLRVLDANMRGQAQAAQEEFIKGLGQEQQAIAKSYFDPSSPDKGNAIAAVAAGMKFKIRDERAPIIAAGMKEKAIATADWETLDSCAQAEQPYPGARSIGENIWEALHGGTGWNDEKKTFANLALAVTPTQRAAVDKYYRTQSRAHCALQDDLRSELSGSERDRGVALARGETATADAAAIMYALHGGLGINDKEAVRSALKGKNKEEIAAITAAYKAKYDKDLEADLKDEYGETSNDWKEAGARLKSQHSLAAAAQINSELKDHWFKGPQYKGVVAVYKDIELEVRQEAKRHKEWNEDDVQAEILKRKKDVEAQFDTAFAGEYDKPAAEGGAMRAAFKQAFPDPVRVTPRGGGRGGGNAYAGMTTNPRLDLVNAVADNNHNAAAAAAWRLESDPRYSAYASDSVLNSILEDQYKRGFDKSQQDLEGPLREDLRRRRELHKKANNGADWTKEEIAAEEDKIRRAIRDRGVENGKDNLKGVAANFNLKYQKEAGGDFYQNLEASMSGYALDEARLRVQKGGYLPPAGQVVFAIKGNLFNDKDQIKNALKDKTPAEIEEIKASFKERNIRCADGRMRSYSELYFGGKDLGPVVDDALGTHSHEALDARQYLLGTTDDPDEKIRRQEEKINWAKTHGGLYRAEWEIKGAEDELARAKQARDKLRDPKLSETEKRFWEGDFKATSESAEKAIEYQRERVESGTHLVAKIIGAVVMAIILVVATVVTGGAAIAAAAGVWATIAATASAVGTVLVSGWMVAATAAAALAEMTTKALMQGTDYLRSDKFLTDMAMAVVDTATAGLGTLKIGGRLLGEGVGAAAKLSTMAKMAESGSRITRMAVHAVSQGVEMLAVTLPQAIASNVFSPENWKGDAAGNILKGIGMQTALGVGMGTGLGMLGGIAKPAARSFEKLAAEERTILEAAFRKKSSSGAIEDLIHEYNAGNIAKVDHAELKKFRQELQESVLKGVPEDLHAAVKANKVSVEVWDNARFNALSKDAEAEAALIVEDGVPKIVLREGASPAVLREEGVHLAQLLEKDTAKIVRSLDEVHLANWEKLSFSEQLALYKNKVTLELDAQKRVIAGLERDILQADSAAARAAMEKELGAARRHLDNLADRFVEIERMPLVDKIRYSQHGAARPTYLDKEPRLFSKTPGEGAPSRLDPDLPRSRPEVKSPLEKDHPGKVFQVGEEFEQNGRQYRLVEAVDDERKIVKMREEILKEDGSWVQRGSESQQRGGVAESASLRQSEVNAAKAERGSKQVRIESQNASGQGFDEARIHFDPDGTPRIKIIEVKDYPGRYVPLEDFTAIRQNLQGNLDGLDKKLRDALRSLKKGSDDTALGMTREQIKDALKALREKRIDFEIRLSPETLLGDLEAGTTLKGLKEDIALTLGIKPSEVRLDKSYIKDKYYKQAFDEAAKNSLIGKKASAKAYPRNMTPRQPELTADVVATGEHALAAPKGEIRAEAQAIAGDAQAARKKLESRMRDVEELEGSLSASPPHPEPHQKAPAPGEPSVLERIEQSTGVKKSAEAEAQARDMRAFLAQQEQEAKNVLRVQDSHLEPRVGGGGYGIESRYDVVEFSHGLTEVKIKVHLDGVTNQVSAAELAELEGKALAGVDRFYNLPPNHLPNGNRLKVEIEFVADPKDAHLVVEVRSGQGRANQNTWYVGSDPTVHAHEIGHQLGLVDEYVDASAVLRAARSSPGVHTDGSLMGNFWARDAHGDRIVRPDTALKQRHLDQIGSKIEEVKVEARFFGEPLPPAGPGQGKSWPGAVEDVAYFKDQHGIRWSKDDIRTYYAAVGDDLRTIDRHLEEAGWSLESRARKALEIRRNARKVARAMLDDGESAALAAEDLARFGSKDGPTFDHLVAEARARGRTGDQIYADVLASAKRPEKSPALHVDDVVGPKTTATGPVPSPQPLENAGAVIAPPAPRPLDELRSEVARLQQIEQQGGLDAARKAELIALEKELEAGSSTVGAKKKLPDGYPAHDGQPWRWYQDPESGKFTPRQRPGQTPIPEGKRWAVVESPDGVKVELTDAPKQKKNFADRQAAAAERNPGKASYGALEDRISAGNQAPEAASAGKPFSKGEAGQIREWGPTLERLGDTRMAAALGDLRPGYVENQYRTFVRRVRKEIIEAVQACGNPMEMLREFVNPAAGKRILEDEATIGTLFREYREAVTGLRGESRFPGLKALDESARLPDGTAADGVLRVEGLIEAGAPPPARDGSALKLLVEDKGGKRPYKLDQAKLYSAKVDAAGRLSTEGKTYDGLVYVFENKDAAERAVKSMDANGVSSSIYVAYFDSSGQFQWTPRIGGGT